MLNSTIVAAISRDVRGSLMVSAKSRTATMPLSIKSAFIEEIVVLEAPKRRQLSTVPQLQ